MLLINEVRQIGHLGLIFCSLDDLVDELALFGIFFPSDSKCIDRADAFVSILLSSAIDDDTNLFLLVRPIEAELCVTDKRVQPVHQRFFICLHFLLLDRSVIPKLNVSVFQLFALVIPSDNASLLLKGKSVAQLDPLAPLQRYIA